MNKTFHYCPVGDIDCPYYVPTITKEKTCSLETAPQDCDSFYELDEGGEDE